MSLRTLTIEDWPEAEGLYRELTASGAVAGRAAFEAVLGHAGTRVL
ncbi:hypothetical protein KO498_17200 [Lentibacter algarum]|nr:hypothetical protein [Lentibacter algarum]MBU2983547.1 hypothetical protein [Lentibacter algarum]